MDKLGRKVLLIGSFAGMVIVESEKRYLNQTLRSYYLITLHV